MGRPVIPYRSTGGGASPQSGFTLLELLVVLFVVAVMSGIAVIQLGSRDRDRIMETEARRMAHLLELARQEAVLETSEWGLQVTDAGYRFLRLDPDRARWEPIEGRPWSHYALPEGIRIELTIEDRQRAPTALNAGERRQQPSLLILSSGEVTPFRLRLDPDWAGASWQLTSDGFESVAAERVPS